MSTISSLLPGIQQLLALTRNESVRATVFNTESYAALPEQIKSLSQVQPKQFILEQSSNQLFNSVNSTFYCIIEEICHAIENKQSIQLHVELLDGLLRIINNICFIDNLRDSLLFQSKPSPTTNNDNTTISCHFTHAFATLTSLIELLLCGTHHITTTMVPISVSTLFTTIATKQNSTSFLQPNQKEIIDILTIFNIVINTIVLQCGSFLQEQSLQHIPATLLSSRLTLNYNTLPYTYQFLYQSIFVTLFYIKSMLQITSKDASATTFTTLTSLLHSMTQLTTSVTPQTSTSSSIQHGLSHPYLISITNIIPNLFQLFHGDNWSQQYESSFQQYFINSTIFTSDGILTNDETTTTPPNWGYPLAIKTPTLCTLLFSIITSLPQDTPTNLTQFSSQLNTSTLSMSSQISLLLYNSIPLLLHLMSDFTSNQIHCCFNEYQSVESTQTPVVTQPNSPTPIPTETKLKSSSLTPTEKRTQQAQSQIAINNTISTYFIDSTSLLTLYLASFRSLRQNTNSTIVISELLESIYTQFVTQTVEILDIYSESDEEIDSTTKRMNATKHLNQSLTQLPSIWDDNLLQIAKDQQPIQAGPSINDGTNQDDEDDEDETNPLIIIAKHQDTFTSPLLATQYIIKSLTTSIMCCKYINSPTPATTPQQQQQQAQQIIVIANEKTLSLQSQQHFNYLVRHIYPYLFVELLFSITIPSQHYSTLLKNHYQNDSTSSTKLQQYQLLTLQFLLQRNVTCMSDIFTALAPLTLSALPCQYLLHSSQPMVSILSFIHASTSYFLQLPTSNFLSSLFPTLKSSSLVPDPIPLLSTFEQIYAPINPVPITQSAFLKIFSSLCYRSMTLLGYIMGNSLPPMTPQQDLPQLRIINQTLMTSESCYCAIHYAFYYIQQFIYKQHYNKTSFQYQLILRINPPIIEVIEGLLTLLLNSALYFQRKPFTSEIGASFIKNDTTTPQSTTPTLHPLTLICTRPIFDFLLRLLTLGWDGDDLRYHQYLNNDELSLDTSALASSQQQPKEMKLIQSLFHSLFTTAYNSTQTRTTTSNDTTAPETDNKHFESIIQQEFQPSQLDSIPGHVLHHKLPNFQAPALRLIRSTLDALTTYFSKSTNSTPTITPFYYTFTPLKIAELLTSLYALVRFCPIPTLQYESSRCFSYLSRFLTLAHPNTPTVLSPQPSPISYNSIISTNGSMIQPFNTTHNYLLQCYQVTAKASSPLPSKIITIEDFIKLVNIHPFMFAPQQTSNKPKSSKPTNNNKNSTQDEVIIQDQQMKLFQQLLKLLLSVNGSSPDGQLLIREAHEALRALNLVPQ